MAFTFGFALSAASNALANVSTCATSNVCCSVMNLS